MEDKIVQHAVVTILNQIYEEDFRGFSYGFRPGRSQHQALDALYIALTRKKVSFVLDADIVGFFDNLDRGWMLKFLQHRVADPRILRLIQKWQEAGVMEEGEWKNAGMGTPQGSVISPLLARCSVPAFDGAFYSQERKEALWARFYTGAPQRQRRSVEQYSIVKRA